MHTDIYTILGDYISQNIARSLRINRLIYGYIAKKYNNFNICILNNMRFIYIYRAVIRHVRDNNIHYKYTGICTNRNNIKLYELIFSHSVNYMIIDINYNGYILKFLKNKFKNSILIFGKIDNIYLDITNQELIIYDINYDILIKKNLIPA
jgi:hypothetical protein